MSKILTFKECNIDGCYTDVEVYIKLNVSDYPLNWREKITNALNSIKEEYIKNDECFDTDQIIQEALEEVFGKGVSYDVICSEYEFEF